MPKRKGEATKQQKDFIQKRCREGASANQIQKEMQSRHMGIKRQRLLAYVRQYKGQRKKPEPRKYVPHKYRKARAVKKYRRARPVKRVEIGKRIAVYGSVGLESRRIQMYGSGRQLYQAMLLAGKYPPKKRFLTASAEDISAYPEEYLDMTETWDTKEVVSH